MDGSLLVPTSLVMLFLIIFLLQCLSTDVVSTIVYAVPFFIIFFIMMARIRDFSGPFQALFSVLTIINVIMIAANLIKSIIS